MEWGNAARRYTATTAWVTKTPPRRPPDCGIGDCGEVKFLGAGPRFVVRGLTKPARASPMRKHGMLMASADDNAGAVLWLTISELANARHVTRQAVHKALRTLAARGAAVETRRDGDALLINVEDYDARRGEALAPHRVAGEATKAIAREPRRSTRSGAGQERLRPPVEPPRESADTIPIATYAAAQARKTTYDAELRKVDLDRVLGRTVNTEEVRKAAEMAAATMAGFIDRLHMRAEELLAAGDRGRLVGMRTALRTVERDLLSTIADEFAKMAAPSIGKDGT
jgi:hypothetical protein